MRRTIVLFAMILLSFSNILTADNFELANRAYKSGDYEKAINLYQTSLQKGEESPVVYFNLGNCYYRTGKIGKAILYYERAALLSPNDEDINYNLSIARVHTIDKIDTTPQFFVFNWFERFTDTFSSGAWMKIMIMIAFVIAVFGIIYMYYRNLQVRRYLALGIMSLFPVLLLCSVFMYARYHEERDNNYAVVTVISTVIKNAPNTTSNDAFVVHEGLKMKIEDTVDEWVKVRLEDGKVGWANINDLEII